MKTVIIKEIYDLSFGTAIVTDTKGLIVGDEIQCGNNDTYIIKSIILPTKPTDSDLVTLVV